MPNINITVADKIATNTTPGVVIVCGNSDYIVSFGFDAEWATEQNRVARFVYYKNGKSLYQEVEFTGNTVSVPILSGVDYVLVGVYAGNLRTTTPAKVLCDRSILCGNQIKQTTEVSEEEMQGYAEAAATSAQAAATSAEAAAAFAQEAAAAVTNALEEAKESGEFNGAPGEPGSNGTSPVVSVSAIDGGHRITIKDVNGTKTVDVMDGKDAIAAETIPEYWLPELEAKAATIQTAMEKAGRKKSAFLWHTDAHWPNGNSKISPKLLGYLHRHTAMNKVNFGGDIIGDSLLATREDMAYLYEWREAIKDLPNHHSVLGNHDSFNSDAVDYEDGNYRYAIMIAKEESLDMVMGDDGIYYYIDNTAEKTRYLYLEYPSTVQADLMAQGAFIAAALKSTPEGWHIVAIAHRWWQYSSSSTPTTGTVPAFEKDILSVFDAYNARTTRAGSNYFYAQDFTAAKGRVEFCVGGHIHTDYDFTSTGGIPVICTTADANQDRVPGSTVDSGIMGTTTEAAVYGIVADYNDTDNTKITVVGVGRGTSRVVRRSPVKPETISDISYSGDTTVGTALDKDKFTFTVNYSNGTTERVTGAASVSPANIETVGDNAVTITYTEGVVTVSGTTTIAGQSAPVANLFDKNDQDIVLRGRYNSSKQVVDHADGQLVTGYIEAAVGDTFTVVSDKSLKTNGYTGQVVTYDSGKTALGSLVQGTTQWIFSEDSLTGTVTIPDIYGSHTFTGTVYARFCVPFENVDNIIITKD